jgi:hypothetical protein
MIPAFKIDPIVEEDVCTNMYISHVCIAINDECEFKCIWTWMNVDKCG